MSPSSASPGPLAGFVAGAERFLFAFRGTILGFFVLLTLVSGYLASGLAIDAGFLKQLPSEHPYIETFSDYREKLPGANAVIVAVEANDGDVWTPEFFQRYYDISDEVFYLPGVDRATIRSMWTPNTRVMEINEEGFKAYNLIPASVTRERITAEALERIRVDTVRGGFAGQYVAHDNSAVLIRFELAEINPITGERLDYIELAHQLEIGLRGKFEDDQTTIRIIGFAKGIGDIADGAAGVVYFMGLALILTAIAVYLYARSFQLMLLAVGSSLVSVVWQFGALYLLGYGLDPLAILVPFLVYAIGVSHGVQQINLFTSELIDGATAETAARSTFSRLFLPGSMALITDLVGFLTLALVPIPIIQEMAIVATVGIALKIISNLIMLPLLASYMKPRANFVAQISKLRASRASLMKKLGGVARPGPAKLILLLGAVLFVVSIYQSRDRHVGDLHAGLPELREDARYNQDVNFVTDNFAISLDAFITVAELPGEACIDHTYMKALEDYGWHLSNVPGVAAVVSTATVARNNMRLWMEDDLRWSHLPRNPTTLGLITSPIPSSTGLINRRCNVMPVIAFLTDHKAETVERVVAAAESYIADYPVEGLTLRLATGNAGIIAATNEVISENELPMLLYVFGAIIVLVGFAYRDWRAIICCCAPLLVATFMGYWFMTELGIGLKSSTLPVLVLAVGIGVDYAFYIYNRLQFRLEAGIRLQDAFPQAMQETGMAVVFTGLTLSIGVASWAFSALKFQADMGLLLSFMFLVNMVGAVTLLPALAWLLEGLAPRKVTRQAD
ncbi:Putative exporter of RND superfamily [Candidatus Phaeomarinobacter ectocarpi]|uniref:Putative exporter of RND superfamily n=1 Tax=Candidatus Phaeomarinibacter ectocarpi TaxID=1458461 RepID=X5MMP0_9HYPH|nr:MMPL family transporter [Candidatus Phaeomarinobacter ectocarpi]CDO59391.1 Putative exporter of RND superfamily [Candidatus Phaeomarinobacter ectocarpi]